MEREPPLRQDELQVLRKMIGEYRYQRQRGIFLDRVISRGRLALAIFAALLMVTLQIVSLYYAAHGRQTIEIHSGTPYPVQLERAQR